MSCVRTRTNGICARRQRRRGFVEAAAKKPASTRKISIPVLKPLKKQKRKSSSHPGYTKLSCFPLFTSRMRGKTSRVTEDMEQRESSEDWKEERDEVISWSKFLQLPDVLHQECLVWIEKSWNLHLQIKRITALTLTRNPVHQKFMNALTSHSNKVLASGTYIFGYHGTCQHNIDSICENGYNPELRKGQSYGPGEYFAVNAARPALQYCKGGSSMLVNLILIGKWYTFYPENDLCVVNNPNDESITYCLPIYVISF